MIDPREFRDVMGAYPTGVCVITAVNADGRRHGMAVGTFSSISLDPPMVGFLPDRKSTTWPIIATTGRFCVNVLGAHQLDLCHRFSARGDDKFAGLSHGHSPSGQPLLDDCLAWVDCTIASVTEVGDHLFVLGHVDAMAKLHDGAPLLFHGGKFHGLSENTVASRQHP
jgi:3-hydroxy-9,10-secoandrosta-1,3,5(10)-triene-9,17-dione monooxygenase reductase component